jgi:putative methylase
MKKKELELKISKLDSNIKKKSELEQYFTPSDIASAILYRAYMEGDIAGKKVADLGTGNGIFAIGAYLLGAEKVYAIDIDINMIELSKKNATLYNAEIEFLNMDVSNFDIIVDTVIMNPPFGSQNKGSDIPFLEKALSISKNFYTLFNYKTSDFLKKFIGKRGELMWYEEINFKVPYTFEFHRKEVKNIKAVVAKVMVWR